MVIAKIWCGSQRNVKGKDWRSYTFRRRSSPFDIEASCLPTNFGGGRWWINRVGDIGLVRSFETSQRTPKTESGIKRYGQTKFSENAVFGRPALWPVLAGREAGWVGKGSGFLAGLGRLEGRFDPESWPSKIRDFGGKTARKTSNRRGNQWNLAMGTQGKVYQQV